MIPILSPRELELGRHALGLDGRRKESYRNRFVCDKGSEDHLVWTGMVEKGLAKNFGSHTALTNGMDFFALNKLGALLCLKYGDKLERAWFDPIREAKEVEK